ncbi:MAG: adenylate/guanylate cyclase domain-containing protein [Conexivisphaerales archaeon]
MEDRRRKIVAIMFTDMVGYTSLSQRSEALALTLLEKQRKVVRSSLLAYGGREIKTIGDAFLATFESSTNALECALAVQSKMAEINSRIGKSQPKLLLRIGIHVGEVVEDKGDIYGDSVNIAARVEPLADEGGICITQAVWEQVKNKVAADFIKMKETKLKNVSDKLQLYSVRQVSNRDKKSEMGASETKRDYVRIAVLPLTDLSGKRDDGFFADGLTDELIFALSRIKALRVIARTSIMKYKNESRSAREISRELDVDYLVEGSVRKSGEQILCQVQLIEANTEESIWAQSYKRDLKDIFETQAEIAQKVCSALRSKIESPYALKVPENLGRTENLNAFTLYLKGRHYWNKRDVNSIKKAIKFFEMSIFEDRKYAKAYSGLADCYIILGNYISLNLKEAFTEAVRYAKKAIKLDPQLAEAHASLGAILGSYYFDFTHAEEEMRKAISLNPSYAIAHHWHADILLALGRLDEAMKELEIAHMLDPNSDIILTALAMSHLYSGDVEGALRYCRQVLKRSPNFHIAYNVMGECYLKKGDKDRALQQHLKASRINSNDNFTLAYLAHAYLLKGDKDRGLEIIDRIKRKVKEPELSSLLAIAYSAYPDVDLAYECIVRAIRGRTMVVEDLRYSPIYASVRSDPRFEYILREFIK